MSFRCKRHGLHVLLALCAVTVAMLGITALSASAFVPCPSGGSRAGEIEEWNTVWPSGEEDAKGVTLCEGTSGEEVYGYLQMVDLGDGARIRSELDPVPGSRYSQYIAEPEADYRKRTARSWYTWLRSLRPEEEWVRSGSHIFHVLPENTRLFSVTNAIFFKDSNNENDTRLPFPVSTVDGESFGMAWKEAHPRCCTSPETEPRIGGPESMWEPYEPGYAVSTPDYEAPKKVLNLGLEGYWEEGRWVEETRQDVGVRTFSPTYYEFDARYNFFDNFEIEGAAEGPWDSLVSFAPEYVVGEGRHRRNYLGVYGDTVYIFTSKAGYTNREAVEVMEEIQPGMRLIQLDGGGSAQIFSEYRQMDSQPEINPLDEREVPNVLAIYRAP